MNVLVRRGSSIKKPPPAAMIEIDEYEIAHHKAKKKQSKRRTRKFKLMRSRTNFKDSKPVIYLNKKSTD